MTVSALEKMQFKIPPWAHQMEVLAKAEKRNCFALLWEMGLGKTSVAINIARLKYMQHGRVLKTLVLGPPVVVENWRREFNAHSNVGGVVFPLNGSGDSRLKYFSKQTTMNENVVFITNYESLLMEKLFASIKKWGPELIICDESHKLKNHSSKRAKRVQTLADQAAYRYLLTGTPITNSPMDLFSQFRILDGGETFGRNFMVFRNKYFWDKNAHWKSKEKYFPCWVPNELMFSEMSRSMGERSDLRKKEECLTLPPLVKKQVYVELSKEQARLYDEMKKDFIAFVKEGTAVATMALTKALRLMQIVSGFITIEGDEGRSNVSITDNPRAQALKDLLSEITSHSKCLVWAVFKDNYKEIASVCDVLGLVYAQVHGGITAKHRQSEIDRFNNDPDCKVFIGNPSAAGIGINLVSASYSIFYSRNFSLDQDLQAEARNYRAGCEQHASITRIDLIANGTIDEIIYERLSQKLEISEKILVDVAKEL